MERNLAQKKEFRNKREIYTDFWNRKKRKRDIYAILFLPGWENGSLVLEKIAYQVQESISVEELQYIWNTVSRHKNDSFFAEKVFLQICSHIEQKFSDKIITLDFFDKYYFQKNITIENVEKDIIVKISVALTDIIACVYAIKVAHIQESSMKKCIYQNMLHGSEKIQYILSNIIFEELQKETQRDIYERIKSKLNIWSLDEKSCPFHLAKNKAIFINTLFEKAKHISFV